MVMLEQMQAFVANPVPSILVVLNIIVIESLLSVDNAAVLATMVLDLAPGQRSAALKYGILGAYLFRGLCLLFAVWLVHFWWLKPFGGLYLLYLVWKWWGGSRTTPAEDDYSDKKRTRLYRRVSEAIGPFWSTVLLIEVMDLAFSIDNVFAAVAFTDNLVLVCTGVFIGILAMRFVAQGFVKIMEVYPFLETCAYGVIFLLGLKLSFSFVGHLYPEAELSRFIEGHQADMVTSGLTIAIFFIPMLTSFLFNIPSRSHGEENG